jgi:ATP-dependent DNA helicase RecG
VRGFEPLQQEQMILQFVDAHGHITRHQAAELCSLSPDQASRLLRRLTAEGKLQRQGERKGATYARPGRFG